MVKNSMIRVQKYLDRLALAKGYHKECIHTFLTGDGTEISLLASDLKALLQFASAAISTTTPPADALDAARYRFLRDTYWGDDKELSIVITLQMNKVWDEKIDEAMASSKGVVER